MFNNSNQRDETLTSRGRILVIDDEVAIVEFIDEVLTEEGYQVEVAYNGRDGLQILRERPPNLVLLDLLMPYINGHTLLRHIAELGLAQPPVIVISANHADEAALARAGAAAFLAKPFTLADLFERVARHIRA